MAKMNYPTIEAVKAADRQQLCAWYRFLPSPETHEQVQILNLVVERFRAAGGFSPEISKRIGF